MKSGLRKLLLVEDSSLLSSRLLELLADAGIRQVTWAGTVREAIAGLADEPDIVSVDLGLPDGSGLEVIRRAKLASPAPEVYVLSGMSDLREVCLAEGADRFFDKNGDIQDYMALVARRMEVRR